jgi:hypothetical protein
MENIQVNVQEYSDRTYQISILPTEYSDCDWIRTAFDSKDYTGASLVTFTVTADMDILVVHNDNIATKPAWLASGWSDTGDEIKDSAGATFSVYSKTYTADSTVTLGNNGSTSVGCYYIILKTRTALITDLVVNDVTNADDWSIRANLQLNDQEFSDRAYRITSLPPVYAGCAWLRSASDSKTYTGNPLISFTVSTDVNVFVVHDDAATPKPAWLTSGWSDTGDEIKDDANGTGATFSVFSKFFPAGTVSLGNNGDPDVCAGYFVIVKAQ